MTPQNTKEQTIHISTNQISHYFGTNYSIIFFRMANSGGMILWTPRDKKWGYISPWAKSGGIYPPGTKSGGIYPLGSPRIYTRGSNVLLLVVPLNNCTFGHTTRFSVCLHPYRVTVPKANAMRLLPRNFV